MRVFKCMVFRFSWDENPEYSEIDKALELVYNGRNRPHLIECSRERGNWLLIVSSIPITEEEAKVLWSQYFDDIGRGTYEPVEVSLPDPCL